MNDGRGGLTIGIDPEKAVPERTNGDSCRPNVARRHLCVHGIQAVNRKLQKKIAADFRMTASGCRDAVFLLHADAFLMFELAIEQKRSNAGGAEVQTKDVGVGGHELVISEILRSRASGSFEHTLTFDLSCDTLER